MRRLRDNQESLWEAVMPREWALQGEWAVLDAVLDDDEFLEPFASRLESRIGRPTIPMERYLRLMVVKHRYGWGYEMLVQEVADSIRLTSPTTYRPGQRQQRAGNAVKTPVKPNNRGRSEDALRTDSEDWHHLPVILPLCRSGRLLCRWRESPTHFHEISRLRTIASL